MKSKHTGKPKYVHIYKDRHGKQRIYFRKSGGRLPLPGPIYSEVFWTAYHEAMNGKPQVTVGKPGTMAELIVRYYSSAEFKGLASSTRETYRRVLDRLREQHGGKPVTALETKHINSMIDAVAQHPAAANNLRDRLSVLLKFAIGAGYRDDNPVLFAKRVKHKTKGFRTWTEADISAFRKRWPVGTPQRLAVEILLFTGLRRSDAVRLGRQHLKDGCHLISTRKSGGLCKLEIPVHPTLAKHLEHAKSDHLTYIVTERGSARSEKAFTSWIREAAHKAGLPSDSSPHGLRKAACRRLAEAGCTPHQIMAITGHANLAEVDTYTRMVNQKRLAKGAMAAILDTFEETEAGTKIG